MALDDHEKIEAGRYHFEHDNGVTVKLRGDEDDYEVIGCHWHASWSDIEMDGSEFGVGETISEDEFARRKSAAIGAARDAVDSL